MKKKFIMLAIAVLSVILVSQTALKFCAVPSLILIEHVVNSSVQNTDHSEEDLITCNHKSSFHKALWENLPVEDHSLTEKIATLIWHPPKVLILKCL